MKGFRARDRRRAQALAQSWRQSAFRDHAEAQEALIEAVAEALRAEREEALRAALAAAKRRARQRHAVVELALAGIGSDAA